MAFPVHESTTTTNGSTATTTQALNMPATVNAGDILIATVRAVGPCSITWPAGWTEVSESGADNSDDSSSIAWKESTDGSEAGGTITITLTAALRMSGLVVRVSGASGETPSFSAVTAGGLGQPNGPNLAPAAGADDYLWLSIGGNEDARTITNPPTGYSNGTIVSCTGSSGAGVCSSYVASKQANAASEDPGAWTLSNVTQYMLWTVAVPPGVVVETFVPHVCMY